MTRTESNAWAPPPASPQTSGMTFLRDEESFALLRHDGAALGVTWLGDRDRRLADVSCRKILRFLRRARR